MLWKILHFHRANVIFAACFTLRGEAHIDLLWFLFVVSRICPLMQEHFLWSLLMHKAFYYGWIRVLIYFLQGACWIWITKRFSLVREYYVFLQCCITLGPAGQFSLQDVKWSLIVIYKSKIIRMKCSLNWSCINHGELHCDSVNSSLVFFQR